MTAFSLAFPFQPQSAIPVSASLARLPAGQSCAHPACQLGQSPVPTHFHRAHSWKAHSQGNQEGRKAGDLSLQESSITIVHFVHFYRVLWSGLLNIHNEKKEKNFKRNIFLSQIEKLYRYGCPNMTSDNAVILSCSECPVYPG